MAVNGLEMTVPAGKNRAGVLRRTGRRARLYVTGS